MIKFQINSSDMIKLRVYWVALGVMRHVEVNVVIKIKIVICTSVRLDLTDQVPKILLLIRYVDNKISFYFSTIQFSALSHYTVVTAQSRILST